MVFTFSNTFKSHSTCVMARYETSSSLSSHSTLLTYFQKRGLSHDLTSGAHHSRGRASSQLLR